MTQYEYVQELSNYLLRKYDTTVTLSKDEHWMAGYHLSFSGRFNKDTYFKAEEERWKDVLIAMTNNVIEGRNPREGIEDYIQH